MTSILNPFRKNERGVSQPFTHVDTALKTKKIKIAVLLVLLFVLVGLAAVEYYLIKRKHNDIPIPDLGTQTDSIASESIVEKVAKHILLPDEEPTIATVSDPALLQSQQFFRNAESGDYILIFKNAKKAVLFRSDEDRIIEVGSVALGTDDTTEQSFIANPAFDGIEQSTPSATPTINSLPKQIQPPSSSSTPTPVVRM